MIVTYVAFRGAFGPHDGIVLEETEDNVLLAVENRDESNFRPLPFEIQFSAWTEQNKNRHKHYRRRSMSLPKMETGNKCPKCAGGRLVSLSTILNRGSEPTACALGAQPDC
jgi:hypothetical protein